MKALKNLVLMDFFFALLLTVNDFPTDNNDPIIINIGSVKCRLTGESRSFFFFALCFSRLFGENQVK